MCDHESFAKLRKQTEKNAQQIAELAKSDAVQSVQIANLAKSVASQGDNQRTLLNRVVMAVLGILVLTVLALIFGGLGERDFNAVTKAAPTVIQSAGVIGATEEPAN